MSIKNYYLGFSKIFRIIQKSTLLLHDYSEVNTIVTYSFRCGINRDYEYICILELWFYFYET